MWIGTRMGLYQLDKQSGVYRYIDLPVESPYICALYQREDGILYIGTRGAGLLVYDINKKKFIHQYRTDNCALISDNIYTIIPRQDENLLMGTENGITIYSPKDHFFRNWTREQGLMSVNFNAGSATTYSNSTLVFGGNDGAVKFPTDIEIPEPYYSRLLLRDFMIAYHPVYPGDDGSPLKKDINETDCLELAYGQNTFSLDVASINYDYPSNILYSWKIDGYHKEWTRPSQDNRIVVRNLPPGSYTLQIRTVSNEEKYKTYETRSIQIIITPPVPDDENHIFLALCEVSPGVIWAGGFTSGIYKIEKKKGFKISYLSPAAIAGIRPDQYIYDIKKDSSGDVWSGGYYHLKRINLETKNVRLYPGVSSITTILEKNGHSCISPWQYNHVIQRLWTL